MNAIPESEAAGLRIAQHRQIRLEATVFLAGHERVRNGWVAAGLDNAAEDIGAGFDEGFIQKSCGPVLKAIATPVGALESAGA